MSCQSQLCADPLARKPHLGVMTICLNSKLHIMQPALLDHDYAQVVLPLDMTRVDGHNLLVAGLSSLQVFDMVGVDVTQEDEAPFTWSVK